MLRKGLAWAILATFYGVVIEMASPRPRLARAPVTGAAMLCGESAITWALKVLGTDDPRTADAPAA